MSINIDSEAWCRKAYLNYHCYGNSMGISADEMGEITTRWSSKLTSWQATVSNDENQYEFDDSEFSTYKENGKEEAQEQTGYEGGGKGKMITRGVVDGVAATGTAFAAGAVSFVIAAPLALATGIAYLAKRPNKEQKEACDELQNVMGNNQAALSETQADMEEMSNELITLSDEANEANEDANGQFEEEKTNYDMFKTRYEALKTKVENGVPLTEEEKAEYQELIQYMTEAGENITEIQEDTTDTVGEIYEDMETYQDGYDYAAETMGEVEGITDFAEEFDTTTRTMCYVEGAAQTVNAASGTLAAGRAVKTALAVQGIPIVGTALAAIAYGFAAIGAAGAAMSGIGAAEQFKWAGDVDTEIDLRKDTQDFNTETMDMYEEEIDTYDGWMQGIQDLELEVPDDVAPPEDTTLPPTTDSGLPAGTPDPIKPDEDPNKAKEEKPVQ